jgi:hypothetical protein
MTLPPIVPTSGDEDDDTPETPTSEPPPVPIVDPLPEPSPPVVALRASSVGVARLVVSS